MLMGGEHIPGGGNSICSSFKLERAQHSSNIKKSSMTSTQSTKEQISREETEKVGGRLRSAF